jgi:invasin B
MTSLYLSKPDLALMAQRMTTSAPEIQPGKGNSLADVGAQSALAFGDTVKQVESAMFAFVAQGEPDSENQPLGLSAPQLATPKAAGSPLSAAHNSWATLLGIMTQLSNSSSDLSLQQLQVKAEQLSGEKQAKMAALEDKTAAYHAAVDLAQSSASTASQDVQQQSDSYARLLAAKQDVATAQEAVRLHPDSQSARQELAKAQATEVLAQANYAQATAVSVVSTQAALDAEKKAADLQDELQAGFNDLNLTFDDGATERHLNASAQLAKVMAMLSNQISDNMDSKQKIQAEAAKASQEANLKKEQTAAEERKKEAKKQAAMSKHVNCAMKILGALITAVSVVSAVFSGGASLALAAVGLAMMAADAITKQITGTSLTERIIQPLMEHVLKPLIDALGSVMTGLLEACGVPKAKAEQVGHIVGAVLGVALMAVVMVAAVVVGKSAAEKLLKPMLKMAQKMAGKMLPKLMNAGEKGLISAGKGVTRMERGMERGVESGMKDGVEQGAKSGTESTLSSQEKTLNASKKLSRRQRSANRLDQGANTMRFSQSVTNGATKISIAESDRKIGSLKALIDMLMALDLMQSLSDSQASKHLSGILAILSNLDSSMAEVLSSNSSRNSAVLSNLVGHAA